MKSSATTKARLGVNKGNKFPCGGWYIVNRYADNPLYYWGNGVHTRMEQYGEWGYFETKDAAIKYAKKHGIDLDLTS